VADRLVPDPTPPGRAAVLGRPVGHSLSPLLHRAAYAALGLSGWTYDALDVGPEDLADLVAGLGPEWRGFSVTMPCKQAAVAVADELVDHAAHGVAHERRVVAPDERDRRRHRRQH
jgi:shikimate dehydrogenase